MRCTTNSPLHTHSEKIWADDGNLESEEANNLFRLMGLLFFLVPLSMSAFVVALSCGPKRKCLLWMKLAALWIISNIVDKLYGKLVTVPFFRADTDLLTKMLLRGIAHSVFVYMDMEIHW